MSFFDRFKIKRSKSDEIERELEETYTAFQQDLLGVPPAEARKLVRDVIASCKQKGQEEGTGNLREDFGDFLILQAREEMPVAARIVTKARNEGAKDDDISEWWNLHDLQRRMVLWSEEVFRYANFLSFLDQGMDADEAMRRVRYMFPMYGDPNETTHVSGEDRLLPHELRGRVDRYREKHGAEAILKWSSSFSTFNAFIRSEIKKGRL
jgi:hypothetical protein